MKRFYLPSYLLWSSHWQIVFTSADEQNQFLVLIQFSRLCSMMSLLTCWIPGHSRDVETQEALLAIHCCRWGEHLLLRQRSRRRHRGHLHHGVASGSPLSSVPLFHFAAQTFVILAGINDEETKMGRRMEVLTNRPFGRDIGVKPCIVWYDWFPNNPPLALPARRPSYLLHPRLLMPWLNTKSWHDTT